MKRLAITLIVGLGLAVPTLAAGQDLPILRPSATVTGDIVRLGDLFDHAGPKADQPIARAPVPGKRVTLEAQWLANVAAAYGLNWRPASTLDRVTLERASNTISRKQIEAELMQVLALEGVGQDAELELLVRDLEMRVPAEATAAVAVRDLQFDRNSDRFSATIEAPAGAADAQRLRITGRVHQITEVPVLTRNLGKDEVIGKNDIEWRRMRASQVRQDTVTDAGQLIGKSPRAYARAGTLLRAMDVRSPVAVAKNALVTMVVRNGAMTLTAQGRAVEEGGVGDTIRVINTGSNVTVQARVDAQNMVSVMPAGRVLAN